MRTYTFDVKRLNRKSKDSPVKYSDYMTGKSGREGVLLYGVMCPDSIPDRFCDPEYLWPSLLKAEKRKDAFLAWNFVMSFDFDLPFDLKLDTLKKYLEDNFTSRGMICEFAVHTPVKTGEKLHIHMLCPGREVDENGNWKKKWNIHKVTNSSGKTVIIREGVNDWNMYSTFISWRKNWEKTWNPILLAHGKEALTTHSPEQLGYTKIKEPKVTGYDRSRASKGERSPVIEHLKWVKGINTSNYDNALAILKLEEEKEAVWSRWKYTMHILNYAPPSLSGYVKIAVKEVIKEVPYLSEETLREQKAIDKLLSDNHWKNANDFSKMREAKSYLEHRLSEAKSDLNRMQKELGGIRELLDLGAFYSRRYVSGPVGHSSSYPRYAAPHTAGDGRKDVPERLAPYLDKYGRFIPDQLLEAEKALNDKILKTGNDISYAESNFNLLDLAIDYIYLGMHFHELNATPPVLDVINGKAELSELVYTPDRDWLPNNGIIINLPENDPSPAMQTGEHDDPASCQSIEREAPEETVPEITSAKKRRSIDDDMCL